MVPRFYRRPIGSLYCFLDVLFDVRPRAFTVSLEQCQRNAVEDHVDV
jgi:hypothetical protein